MTVIVNLTFGETETAETADHTRVGRGKGDREVTEEEVQVGVEDGAGRGLSQDSRDRCEGCFLPRMLGGRRTFQLLEGARGFTRENGGCRRALELHFLKEPWMKKAQGKEKSRDVSLA